MDIIESLVLIPALPNSPAGKITLYKTKKGKWMVLNGNFSLNKMINEFCYPPASSEKTDEFEKEHTFENVFSALDAFNKWMNEKAGEQQFANHLREHYDYDNLKEKLQQIFS